MLQYSMHNQGLWISSGCCFKPAATAANEHASEPTRAARGLGAPASERVGESEGRSPSE
jgi:hypothetical protein